MRKIRLIFLIFLIFSTLSCKKEIYSDSGYIIGFDPCTGAYPDNLDKGFVIITIGSKDTLLTYNLPHNLFTFPPSYFYNYKYDFLFPDSTRYSYKINFKYSFTEEKKKIGSFCFGDIFLGAFYLYTKNRQIIITSANKY